MKVILLSLVLLSSFSWAQQYKATLFFDMQYHCNNVDGPNTHALISAASLEEAKAKVLPFLNNRLVVGCNQITYVCAHNHGDVEPRATSRTHSNADLKVIGVGLAAIERDWDNIAFVGENFDRNFRRMPRCSY